MGYTTKLDGVFTLDKPLFDSQVLYLLELARTRRVKRNIAVLQNVPDSARVAVGLPLGEDGGEKFYHYIAWLQYLIIHFLETWGYLLNGSVKWIGVDPSDTGHITVENNLIVWPAGRDFLKSATEPIPVPTNVLQGLESVTRAGTNLHSWLAAVRAAIELGYPETATWIESNLEKYAAGVKRGFVADNQLS